MPMFRHSLSKRDVVLLFLGASCMHIFNSAFSPFSSYSFDSSSSSLVINTHLDQYSTKKHECGVRESYDHPIIHPAHQPISPPTFEPDSAEVLENLPAKQALVTEKVPDIFVGFPETTIISHAPGWTIFRNLYMAGGTLFIVSSHSPSYFPEIRMMTSTGLEAFNTPENIALREPTRDNMDFISPQEAKYRWGGDAELGESNRVWSVRGNTILFNDPRQFLRHYYHFVAELLFGMWSFWTGAFSDMNQTPTIDRMIFAHSNADGWRDSPGFNAYFLRAAFPSVTVEHQEDWADRITATHPPKSPYNFANPDPHPEATMRELRKATRAWHFPVVLLADRSAAHRGPICGSQTQRTASEAYEAMHGSGKLDVDWWDPLKKAVLRFAGANENVVSTGVHVVLGSDSAVLGSPRGDVSLIPKKVVITYISRQKTRRRLIHELHDELVSALQALVYRRGWELNVVEAEKLSKDEQVRIMGRTTIMLGVHGNGLTHLVLMPRTRVSTVIEIFIPNGFAHDYEWTTRALGMKHFAVWNDTYHTFPNSMRVDYPDGFQGSEIPVHGPTIIQLIEDRVDGKL